MSSIDLPAAATTRADSLAARRDGTDRPPRHPSRGADCGVVSRALNLDADGAFALIGEALSLGRELWLEASGESMYPVVPSGSRVLLAPRRRFARPGDIVLVRRGERLILHRVKSAAGDSLVTRGDACPAPDPPIAGARAIGLAIACDDGRGVRPISAGARWFGVLALARWARVEAHRRLRRWRR
jgi:hypothetical protein